MRIPILVILAIAPLLITAQTFEVTGAVKDVEGNPLPYSNVLLLQISDSTLVKGISADDSGNWRLQDIPADLYYLQAKYFGYQSVLVPLEIQSDLKIGAIVMEPNREWLDEVVVTGQLPTIQRKADRIVFTVENTVVSEGTTLDILRNAPGVIMVQESLEIRGREATIYLNNRKVQLSPSEIQDFLRGLSGNLISAIEVIPNPPASYEAEDGPILNILTTENVIPGYKGSLRAHIEQAVFPKYSLGTSQYYKSEKFSIFANYVVNPRKEFRTSESGVRFINTQDMVFADWATEFDKITRSYGQQANVILDYKPGDRDLLNITSNLSYSPNKEVDNKVRTIMRNGSGQLDSTLLNESTINDDLLNLSVDLNYEHKFKKEGALIKANAHYTFYELSRTQDGSSDYFDASDQFLRNFSFSTDALQDINIYTGQLDYYSPIKGGTFESGIKASNIASESGIDYFDVNNSQPPFNIALSDKFNYNESVIAAYSSLSMDWKQWLLKLGVRAEQTDVKADSETLQEINRQSYFELFPSLFLTRKLGENHSLSFDYSRKLTRPKYSDLNPFRYFLNENDFDEGNPNLVPNFSHNFNLNFNVKDTYFFDVYYRDNGAYISTLSFQDNENQTIRQLKQNVLESISYGLDFTIATSLTSYWHMYLYNSVFYEDETFLAVESDITSYKNVVRGFYSYLSNSLTLSNDGTFTGNLAFTYLSGFLLGSYQRTETIDLNIGLRKSLWDNRAVISLVAEDLLGRANATYTSRYANQDNTIKSVPETQFIRLGFTYNFGNYRLSGSNRSLQKSELDRLEND